MFISVETTPDLLPARAFLNGVDVSNDCIEADDEAGYALLIAKEGPRRGEAERVEGDVRIELGKKVRSPGGKEMIVYG